MHDSRVMWFYSVFDVTVIKSHICVYSCVFFNLTLVATDNGFFLIKFSSEYDYEYAMLGGPWMIFNHYLTVR